MSALLFALASLPLWLCDGSKFDSTCQPANGHLMVCDYFPDNNDVRPHAIPMSYAEDGRIGYCAWPKDAASADTRPKGGDGTKIAAPFTGGAVPQADAQPSGPILPNKERP